MSIRKASLFDGQGKGTPLLFAQLRQRMPLQPVQSRAVLVDGGFATRYFAEWARAAFPSRAPLPADRISDRLGVGSDRFWDWLS